MGFTIYYRSTKPVAAEVVEAVERDRLLACQGYTWLSCEPVGFFAQEADGHLMGGSKPNFQPHPDDVASAAKEDLPDGTTRTMLDVLCQLSRDHDIDWAFSHDEDPGPIGYIRGGVCDEDVQTEIEVFADISEVLGGMLGDLEDEEDLA